MKSVFKTLAIALVFAAGGTSIANAQSTVIYHNDGTKSLVVTDGDNGTVVYRDHGDGQWRDHGYHGEKHPHWEVVSRRTEPGASVSDAPKVREPRTTEPKEPREPREPRERFSSKDI